MSASAKVIKDTMKRYHHVKKTSFLTVQVSATIEQKTLLEYKDPDCRTVFYCIGIIFLPSITRTRSECEPYAILYLLANRTRRDQTYFSSAAGSWRIRKEVARHCWRHIAINQQVLLPCWLSYFGYSNYIWHRVKNPHYPRKAFPSYIKRPHQL